MTHHYRNPSGRSEPFREGRDQGFPRDAFRGGNDYQSNEFNDRFRGSEADRNRYPQQYSQYRDRGDDSRFYGQSADQGHGYPSDDRDDRLRDWGQFDDRDRWSRPGGGGRDVEARNSAAEFLARGRGTATSRWHEDQGSGGGYFNTGSYVDDGASRSLSGDFYRARAEQEREFGNDPTRESQTKRAYYGRSHYGSQPSYGRGQAEDSLGRPWSGERGGSYEDRSSWNYGAGSGSSRGGSFAGAQSFRGRGPRGYQRSDERLKEMICERLTDDPAIDASNITIDVNAQVVKLTGTVDDRGTKYEVEELIEQMGGVKDIDNQLKVQSSRWGAQQQSDVSGSQSNRDWEGSSGASAAGSSVRSGTASSGTSTTGSSGASPSKRN